MQGSFEMRLKFFSGIELGCVRNLRLLIEVEALVDEHSVSGLFLLGKEALPQAVSTRSLVSYT